MKFSGTLVLFGNGEIPTHPIVVRKLKLFNTFLCTDGGADKLLQMGFSPDVILGDMDSISKNKSDYNCETIFLEDQSKSDLEKSLEWCIDNDIKELSLIGFSGGRDDQHFVNLHIMKHFAKKIKMTMYTDHSIIRCINQHMRLDSRKGQTVSIVALNDKTKIKTTGLEYSLNQSGLASSSHGISNTAVGQNFTVHPSDWVWVFTNHMP